MNSSASVADVWTPLTRSRRGRSKRDCTRHPGLDRHFKNLRGIGRFFPRKLADSTGSNFVTCSFFYRICSTQSVKIGFNAARILLPGGLFNPAADCTLRHWIASLVGSARTASSSFAWSTRRRRATKSRVGVWKQPAGFPTNLCVAGLTRIQPPTWKNCPGLKLLSVALVGGLKRTMCWIAYSYANYLGAYT
jgi:hypothetical protein